MTATAFALVTASAMLHVFWNAAVRHADGSRRFVWLLTWGAGLAGLLASGASLGAPGLWHAWPWLSASIALNALYFLALARTYADGELSWAYPLSRGVAVAVSAPLALLLFDQRMGPATWAGLGLVVGGLGLLEGRAAVAREHGGGEVRRGAAAPHGAGVSGGAGAHEAVGVPAGLVVPEEAGTGHAVPPAHTAVPRGMGAPTGAGARAGVAAPEDAGAPSAAVDPGGVAAPGRMRRRDGVGTRRAVVGPEDAGEACEVGVPAGEGAPGSGAAPGGAGATAGAVGPPGTASPRNAGTPGDARTSDKPVVSGDRGATGATATPGGTERRDAPGLLWPVCVGLLVSGYSLVDSQGVRSAPPLPYAALEYLGSALLITPAMRGAPRVARPAGALAAGALSLVSYVCMLYAYRLAPVAPALAVRQIAPALAPLAGALLLRERITPRRAWGTAAIVAGAALMALGR